MSDNDIVVCHGNFHLEQVPQSLSEPSFCRDAYPWPPLDQTPNFDHFGMSGLQSPATLLISDVLPGESREFGPPLFVSGDTIRRLVQAGFFLQARPVGGGRFLIHQARRKEEELAPPGSIAQHVQTPAPQLSGAKRGARDDYASKKTRLSTAQPRAFKSARDLSAAQYTRSQRTRYQNLAQRNLQSPAPMEDAVVARKTPPRKPLPSTAILMQAALPDDDVEMDTVDEEAGSPLPSAEELLPEGQRQQFLQFASPAQQLRSAEVYDMRANVPDNPDYFTSAFVRNARNLALEPAPFGRRFVEGPALGQAGPMANAPRGLRDARVDRGHILYPVPPAGMAQRIYHKVARKAQGLISRIARLQQRPTQRERALNVHTKNGTVSLRQSQIQIALRELQNLKADVRMDNFGDYLYQTGNSVRYGPYNHYVRPPISPAAVQYLNAVAQTPLEHYERTGVTRYPGQAKT